MATATTRLVLRSERIRAIVRAELQTHKAPAPAPAFTDLEPFFVDAAGVRHALDPQLRNRLKPRWRTMLDPSTGVDQPPDAMLADRARSASAAIDMALAVVGVATGGPIAGRILEIGCYDGAAAFRLAGSANTTVVASDLVRYYAVSRPGLTVDEDLTAQQAWLDTLRERARVLAGTPPGVVEFVEDDVTASHLEPASFDAIVSFEVLEHVADPGAAFRAMAGLLRPGGLMYHDYNPFFSSNGGHSLATLDFPWGHARLDPADVERYLRGRRPDEAEQGLRFYLESLNRMSLADLHAAIAAAGLEIITVLPWLDRRLASEATAAVLADVRRTYPGATVEDLLATFVSVVARRPDETVQP